MKKIYASVAFLAMTVTGISTPAFANPYRTTISISVPKYASAGAAVQVSVSVCSLASQSDSYCDYAGDRIVTLFVNKKKFKSARLSYGIASFSWTAARAGTYKLSAQVARVSGYPAVASEAIRVSIGKKTLKTPLTAKYCDSLGCSSNPMTIYFDDSSARMSGLLGKATGPSKGRTAHLQYADTKNKWYSYRTQKVVWNSEFKQYAVDFSMQLDSTSYCTNSSDTFDWAYRILIDGTSKYAPSATPMRIMHYDCLGSSGSTGISQSDDYYDQTIDSSYESVPTINVDVLDPDYVGYEIRSYFCVSSCEFDSSWAVIDYNSSIGDDSFGLSADWGLGTGAYQFRVEVKPDDASDLVYSSIYSIYIY